MAARTDAVMDIAAHFRTLLRDVDTSLLDEWELLAHPDLAFATAKAARAARAPVDPVAERRALLAAVRAELHKLMRALARRDYATAARLVQPGDDGESWTAERLEAAMAPFFAAHTELLTTPDARRPDRTRIDDLDAGRLRAQQAMIDPEGDEDWSLDCVVDVAPGGPPRLALTRIGV